MPGIYDPLDASRAEIRLIALLPGEDASEVHCTLQTVSLDDHPPGFVALSYVWGDPTDRAIVTVEDRRLEVPRNLRDVLHNIRERHDIGSPLLWADAICIDQTNNVEKGFQIPLMGKIYSQAESVFVWLDSPTIAMTKALEWTERQERGDGKSPVTKVKNGKRQVRPFPSSSAKSVAQASTVDHPD